MTTQRKPKTVTIPQAEYSALLGVVAAHRADAGHTPSKVLEHYDSVTRKPSLTPHEVDRGGRVFYVEDGKVYEGRKHAGLQFCTGCAFAQRRLRGGCGEALEACGDFRHDMGSRTLHPVQAVG